MVSAEYVRAEVARSIEQLNQCQEVLKTSPVLLPTKAITLAGTACKSAATLLGVLKDAQPKTEDKPAT